MLLLTQWAVLRNQASSKIMDCLGQAHIKRFRTSNPITHMISKTYSMADWERGKDSDSMTQLFLGQGPMHSNYLYFVSYRSLRISRLLLFYPDPNSKSMTLCPGLDPMNLISIRLSKIIPATRLEKKKSKLTIPRLSSLYRDQVSTKLQKVLLWASIKQQGLAPKGKYN